MSFVTAFSAYWTDIQKYTSKGPFIEDPVE